MKTFEARYKSSCTECSSGIEPGDEVTYNLSGEVVHVNCEREVALCRKEGDTSKGVPGDICPKCWMVRANSGDCGCF